MADGGGRHVDQALEEGKDLGTRTGVTRGPKKRMHRAHLKTVDISGEMIEKGWMEPICEGLHCQA